MASSLQEDLNFFGQSIPTTEEGLPRESFSQKASLSWEGDSYQLESDYDWDEKQVYTCLYRNGALVLYQPADLTLEQTHRPLAEQVLSVLQQELDQLNAALRLRSRIGKDPQFLNGLGLYFYSKNLWEEAHDLFRKAIERKSDFSEAYRNLSNVFLKLGLPEKSLQLLEMAVHLNPSFADLHNALAWVYLECGQHADARTHLETAIGLNSRYYEAYLNLCLSYLQSCQHPDDGQHLPAPEETLEILRKLASQDDELKERLPKLTSWEDISRQYLILKDQQARRDTTTIRASCELIYIRYLKDRENLGGQSLKSFISWLSEKIAKGNNYADLRNYLGSFCLFWASYFVENAKHSFRKCVKAGYNLEQGRKREKQIRRLEKSIKEISTRLLI